MPNASETAIAPGTPPARACTSTARHSSAGRRSTARDCRLEIEDDQVGDPGRLRAVSDPAACRRPGRRPWPPSGPSQTRPRVDDDQGRRPGSAAARRSPAKLPRQRRAGVPVPPPAATGASAPSAPRPSSSDSTPGAGAGGSGSGLGTVTVKVAGLVVLDLETGPRRRPAVRRERHDAVHRHRGSPRPPMAAARAQAPFQPRRVLRAHRAVASARGPGSPPPASSWLACMT